MNGCKLLVSCLLWVVCFPAFAQKVTYIHTDALGSPVVLTDANRNVVERREYEPYGRQLTPAPQDGPGYTGHVYDAATGMVYMEQRYYDPFLGKFLSVDPVTAYGTDDMRLFNRYAYAANNPYRFNDPNGRAPKSICESNIKRCSSIIQVGPATMRDGDHESKGRRVVSRGDGAPRQREKNSGGGYVDLLKPNTETTAAIAYGAGVRASRDWATKKDAVGIIVLGGGGRLKNIAPAKSVTGLPSVDLVRFGYNWGTKDSPVDIVGDAGISAAGLSVTFDPGTGLGVAITLNPSVGTYAGLSVMFDDTLIPD